jgi:hypothetical protein
LDSKDFHHLVLANLPKLKLHPPPKNGREFYQPQSAKLLKRRAPCVEDLVRQDNAYDNADYFGVLFFHLKPSRSLLPLKGDGFSYSTNTDSLNFLMRLRVRT